MRPQRGKGAHDCEKLVKELMQWVVCDRLAKPCTVQNSSFLLEGRSGDGGAVRHKGRARQELSGCTHPRLIKKPLCEGDQGARKRILGAPPRV